MSNVTTTLFSSLPSEPKPKPPAQPIEPLQSSSAKTYTHVHPVLLLSLYAVQFPTIVRDPVPGLLVSLAGTAVLQVVYAVVCLPPTGAGSAEKRKPGEKGKKVVKGEGVAAKIVPALLSLLASFLVAIPVLFGVLVLFGAPVTSHLEHTALCAAHIALLTTLPLVYTHGIQGEVWREIVALLRPVDEVYGGLIGTCLGAWCGAVPIPLDWDREWQKWPVTIVTGAYIGFAAGKWIGGTALKGKTISLD